jgi:DNA-binding GntR family transcriptional regulator
VLTPNADFEDTVSTLYGRLRAMASGFAFKPGERLNESALSRDLGASRTPLREALNRLVAEGFIDFRAGKGFFCRDLSPERILSLYQARIAVECEAARLAACRGAPGAIEALRGFLDATAVEYRTCTDAARLMDLDETFHTRLCRLSGNPEFTRMLGNIYDRIRFVRLADLRGMQMAGRTSSASHRAILDTVAAGDPQAASEAMRAHIESRLDHARDAVRLAYADLYAPLDDHA